MFFFILICLVFSLSYLYKNICCRKNQKRELEDTTGSVNSSKDYECKVLNEADHDSIEFIEQDDTHSNYICYYAFSGRLAVYDLATNSLIAQGISFMRLYFELFFNFASEVLVRIYLIKYFETVYSQSRYSSKGNQEK